MSMYTISSKVQTTDFHAERERLGYKLFLVIPEMLNIELRLFQRWVCYTYIILWAQITTAHKSYPAIWQRMSLHNYDENLSANDV